MNTNIRYISYEDGSHCTAIVPFEIKTKHEALRYLIDQDYCVREVIRIHTYNNGLEHGMTQ